MDPVDQGEDQPMNDDEQKTSEQKMDILTVRFDAMSTMMMTLMADNKQKMDAIMISMGPQGDQAREMGELKKALKSSDEKNDVRFNQLEDNVYQNKKKEVRFDENAN